MKIHSIQSTVFPEEKKIRRKKGGVKRQHCKKGTKGGGSEIERKGRNKPESEQKQPEDYKMFYSERRGHYPLPPTLLPLSLSFFLSLSPCENTDKYISLFKSPWR